MLNCDELNKLMQVVEATREDEIDCEECLSRVDQFVETKLAGLEAEEAMPLVEDHLQKCGDCREEFEALLAALESAEEINSGVTYERLKRLWRRARRAFEE